MNIVLEKIISGGQTGADQGGLEAGRALGIPTGGYAPLGWRTEKGPMPELGTVYGLVETETTNYLYRNELCVRECSGSLIIADNVDSTGTRATIRLLKQYKKPYIINPTTEDFLEWLRVNQIRTLNVVGNR